MSTHNPVMTYEQLKKKRNKLGYSQPEMAKALGVTKSAVSRWESGKRKIPAMAERLLKTMT